MADPVESGSYTPETIARRLKMAEAMLTGEPKVEHWSQGLNELLKGYVGGSMFRKAEDDERAGQSAQYAAIANILGGGMPGGAPGAGPSPSMAPSGPSPSGPVPSSLGGAPPVPPPADTTPIVPKPVPTQPMPPVRQAMEGAVVPGANPYTNGGPAMPLDDPSETPGGRAGIVAALTGPNARPAIMGPSAPPPGLPPAGPTPSTMPPGPTSATPLPPQDAAPPPAAAAQPLSATTDQAASRAKIAAMLRDPNPYVRKMGMQLGQQIAAKMVTGPEWTPVAGPNGALMQRSSTGELKAHPLADDYDVKNLQDGTVVAVSKKDPTKFHVIQNAAVTQGLVNYEGQKKQAETEGEVRGKTTANLPAALENANFALDTLNKLENHPGLSAGTGLTGMARRQVPGTEPYNFNVLLEQTKGQAFLSAYESLRGAGAITDNEGKAATAARARMDAAQSEPAFREALRDYKKVIQSGINRLRASSGKSSAEVGAIQGQVGPASAGGAGPKVRRFNPETNKIE